MDMTLNTHVQRIIGASLIVGTFGLAAWGGTAIASADERGMNQSDFPCQEDEVLGYAPQFGPDRVGCIHIEEFTGPNNAWDAGSYVGGYN